MWVSFIKQKLCFAYNAIQINFISYGLRVKTIFVSIDYSNILICVYRQHDKNPTKQPFYHIYDNHVNKQSCTSGKKSDNLRIHKISKSSTVLRGSSSALCGSGAAFKGSRAAFQGSVVALQDAYQFSKSPYPDQCSRNRSKNGWIHSTLNYFGQIILPHLEIIA